MKDIFLFIIILSIYISYDWIYFLHGMVVEIVFNNEIQIFSFQINLYFQEEKKKFV
jgi:hypothetical protein